MSEQRKVNAKEVAELMSLMMARLQIAFQALQVAVENFNTALKNSCPHPKDYWLIHKAGYQCNLCDTIIHRKTTDLMDTLCFTCGNGTYVETSQYNDIDGILHCNSCNSRVKR